MFLKIFLLSCFVSFLFVTQAAAWSPDSTQTITISEPAKKKKLSLTPFPALFYSPETGFGFGALVVPVYNFGKDSLTRNSTGQILVYYTTKKQSSAQLSYTIYTNQERYAILGETNYYDAPIFYYGTGNHNSESDSSLISYKLIYTQNRILKQLKKNVFLGGQFQVIRVGKADFNAEEGKLDDRPAAELDGYTAVGVGPSFLFDSRDNSINAYHGSYVEIGSYLKGKTIGSEFNFTRQTIDARKFFPLGSKQVIAVQAKGIFESGAVPYRELAYFGGHRNMRGFYEGRFRDKNLMQFQGEYRLHFFNRPDVVLFGGSGYFTEKVGAFLKRSGVVLFGSAGQVASKISNFGLDEMKYSYGLGYRFMLNTTDRVNVRIDYARGTGGTSGLYFAIGETF